MEVLMWLLILGRHSLNVLPKLKDNILEAMKEVITNILKPTTLLSFEIGFKNKYSSQILPIFLIGILWLYSQNFTFFFFSFITALICCRAFVFWSFGKCSKWGEATKDRWCVPGSFGADSLRDLNPAGLHRRRLDTAGVNDEPVKLFTGLSSAFVKKKKNKIKKVRQILRCSGNTKNTHFLL